MTGAKGTSLRPTPSGGGPASRVNALFRRLESDIVARVHRPGDKLPTENELAQREGVSRTVVREAVARLVAQGLVVSRQGSGLYVSEMAAFPAFQIAPSELAQLDDVIRLLELRLALEAEMASLAAIRRTFDDIADLRRALAAIAESATSEDAVAADVEFHLAIARSAKNDYYLRFLEFLGARLVPPRSLLLRDMPEAHHRAYAEKLSGEHMAILDAIVDQDPVKARAASRHHMQTSLERHAALHREHEARSRQADHR